MDHADPFAPIPPSVSLVSFGHVDRDRWAYSPALGEFIADMYVETPGGLWGVASAFPDRVPPPRIVTAWKRQYPAFGLLMGQAERLRAERLLEESLALVDTATGSPARVALQVSARQYTAERLDRARYGKTPGDSSSLSGGAGNFGQGQLTAADVSDDTLAQLALSGQAAEGTGG